MPCKRLVLIVISAVLAACSLNGLAADGPLLLQQPTVSQAQIGFVYADDIWVADRAGGTARRLTTDEGLESSPHFSPDGNWIAFTGNYDGNTDVFLISAQGGVPTRLTYHPGADSVRGWKPDGSAVLFTSSRNSYSRFSRLFTVSTEGGQPEQVPLPIALYGAFSPDGEQMAYDPRAGAYQTWKRYRGGRASVIWVADLSDSSVFELPREDWNDFNPMWLGNKIYFLSDRDDYVTLYSYDTRNKRVKRELEHQDFDIKWASAGPDTIVYEQFGSIKLFDPRSGRSKTVSFDISADVPSARPHYVQAATGIQSAAISPTGKRAVFGARGEILTVPAEKGDIRNLTKTTGAAERDPAWSADGRWIAYFSDESGEYELHLKEQSGLRDGKRIQLEEQPTFYYGLDWSPDSKYLAYTDKAMNLWIMDVAAEKAAKLDKNPYRAPFPSISFDWSSDSRWLVYSRQLDSHISAIFVHDLENRTSHQITDGLSDARHPIFDRNGKYIYFSASTDIGPTIGWGEMSSLNRPVTRSVYATVLSADDPSPLARESDEEPVKDEDSEKEEGEASEDEDTGIRIDFENIDQRILALPIPAQNVTALAAGPSGSLFVASAGTSPGSGPGQTLQKFSFVTRKAAPFMQAVQAFVVSRDSKKMLVLSGGRNWAIVGTQAAPEGGDGRLNLASLQVRVDPREEWRQIYREVWRIERDFLYDVNAHGLDLARAEKTYSPFLNRLASRNELNYLLSEMLGNLVLGHTRNGGGDIPNPDRVPGGLLGADFTIENGRYRISKIYRGENWNPNLRAPLTEPGVKVREEDYLLAVNGVNVESNKNIYNYFENTSGKSIVLEVASSLDGSDSREATVTPVGDEFNLRHREWIDENRRKVSEMTDGRAGYVYLPNTGGPGFTNFNRYYYAQTGKQAMVIDERFNGGGLFANWIVEQMARPLINFWEIRDSKTLVTPAGQVLGPKVMLINEFAGSGGDWMPWYFQRRGVGKLVGKRTWGGLVGVYGFPTLMDGGSVTAPNLAFWTPEREWLIENVGQPPDIDVEFDPKAWREGRDLQLEKAVDVLMKELEENPLKEYLPPEYPDYYKNRRQPGGKVVDPDRLTTAKILWSLKRQQESDSGKFKFRFRISNFSLSSPL